MEFQHVLKKEHVEVPGINFNKCIISMGLGFCPWTGIQFPRQRGVTQFCVEFSGVKVCFLWKC